MTSIAQDQQNARNGQDTQDAQNTQTAQAAQDGLRGAIVRPTDPAFATLARTALAVAEPAVVVRPVDTADVVRAVRLAAASGLDVAVRGGGHSAAGWGTVDGGLVIDLAELTTVEMLDERLVRVGGGARWRDVMAVLAPLGLLVSSGDTADVGVGGLTLSGGVGWAVRRDGLALDRLRAVEMVTASGDVIRADAEHEPELFWAVRGGGGAFGIVTAFEFEAADGGDVDVVTIGFAPDAVERVLPAWASFLCTADERISSTLALADPRSGGRDARVRIRMVVTDGADAAAAASTIAAADASAEVEIARMPYPAVLDEGAALPPGLGVVSRSEFAAGDADAALAHVARAARAARPLPFTVHALGGAFSRVGADSTAFAHRAAEFLITTFSVAPTAALPAVRAAQDEVWSLLHPLCIGAYANGLDGGSAQAVDAIHPDAVRARLRAVKDRLDPRGLFGRNFGPAGSLASGPREDA